MRNSAYIFIFVSSSISIQYQCHYTEPPPLNWYRKRGHDRYNERFDRMTKCSMFAHVRACSQHSTPSQCAPHVPVSICKQNAIRALFMFCTACNTWKLPHQHFFFFNFLAKIAPCVCFTFEKPFKYPSQKPFICHFTPLHTSGFWYRLRRLYTQCVSLQDSEQFITN